MILSNQKGVDRFVRDRNACTIEKVSFYIGLEDSVRVDRSEMTKEGIANRRASISKTSRSKSNVGKRLGQEIGEG